MSTSYDTEWQELAYIGHITFNECLSNEDGVILNWTIEEEYILWIASSDIWSSINLSICVLKFLR